MLVGEWFFKKHTVPSKTKPLRCLFAAECRVKSSQKSNFGGCLRPFPWEIVFYACKRENYSTIRYLERSLTLNAIECELISRANPLRQELKLQFSSRRKISRKSVKIRTSIESLLNTLLGGDYNRWFYLAPNGWKESCFRRNRFLHDPKSIWNEFPLLQ